MWAITQPQLLCTVSCEKIFDLSNKLSHFRTSNFVLLREKPTRTNVTVNLDFVQTKFLARCIATEVNRDALIAKIKYDAEKIFSFHLQ